LEQLGFHERIEKGVKKQAECASTRPPPNASAQFALPRFGQCCFLINFLFLSLKSLPAKKSQISLAKRFFLAADFAIPKNPPIFVLPNGHNATREKGD
jgi:hypothetical protein